MGNSINAEAESLESTGGSYFTPDIMREAWEPGESQIAYDKAYSVNMSNQMIKGRQPMRLRELKIFRLLISQVRPDAMDFETFKIPLSLLSHILGINSVSSLKRDIKKIAMNLSTQVLAINNIRYTDDGEREEEWEMYPIMEYAQYKDRYLQLKLSNRLLPFLTNLKGDYTGYPITTLTGFTSIYALRVYELLLMAYNRSYRKNTIFKISLNQLRTVLRDPQETEEKYQSYYNFKKRVIIPAVEQINANLLTEFTVQFTAIKDGGRDVVAINFAITPRAYYDDIRLATGEELEALKKAKLLDNLLNKADKKSKAAILRKLERYNNKEVVVNAPVIETATDLIEDSPQQQKEQNAELVQETITETNTPTTDTIKDMTKSLSVEEMEELKQYIENTLNSEKTFIYEEDEETKATKRVYMFTDEEAAEVLRNNSESSEAKPDSDLDADQMSLL